MFFATSAEDKQEGPPSVSCNHATTTRHQTIITL